MACARILLCTVKRTPRSQLGYYVTSRVQHGAAFLNGNRLGIRHGRSYSTTNQVPNSEEKDAFEEPPRPEHAVISTFDLFSIGGRETSFFTTFLNDVF